MVTIVGPCPCAAIGIVALDAAIELKLDHGGWCPKHRRAEDGVIPRRYHLTATDSADYKVRTEKNVVDSDGTLILCRGPLRGGTLLTRQLAAEHKRQVLVIDLLEVAGNNQAAVRRVYEWMAEHQIEVLNVAGPRESQNPGIAAEAQAFLKLVLAVA